MAQNHDQAICSEDEIFFGKLTLNEIRKHIMYTTKDQRQTISGTLLEKEDSENSFKIIETHSEPDINSISFNLSSESPVKNCIETLERLLNKDNHGYRNTEETDIEVKFKNSLDLKSQSDTNILSTDQQVKQTTTYEEITSDITCIVAEASESDPAYLTPVKTSQDINEMEAFGTPLTDVKEKTSLFKTPAPCTKKPLTCSKKTPQKPSTCSKKTPLKTNAYQHIPSPVAAYINSSSSKIPQMKNTKKPLTCTSIPKLVKSSSQKKLHSNKENSDLLCFENSVEKNLVKKNIPEKSVKKVVSSLPRLVHKKHDSLTAEDSVRESFGDLSLRQADISICTKKSAFIRPKK